MGSIFKTAIAAALVAACTFSAQAEVSALRIYFKDPNSRTHNYVLSGAPVITHSGDKFKIATDDHDGKGNPFSAEIEFGDIDHIEFDDQAVTSVKDLENNLTVDLSDPHHVRISGMSAEGPVCIHNMSGVLMRRDSAADGAVDIYTGDLPAGIYIVSSPETTFKFIRK